MRFDRPASGEELNRGDATEARQAASLILLRGSADGPEVLLVQRNPEQRFMGGAWVFPGGAVDAEEAAEGDLAHRLPRVRAGGAEGDLAHRLAGVREVEEEAGVALPGPDALHPFSRWITPREVKIRFDTHF